MLTNCSPLYPEADVMVLQELREFRRQLCVVRPNARTKLEILRKLLEFIRRPGVIPEVVIISVKLSPFFGESHSI